MAEPATTTNFWRDPDYTAVFKERARRLLKLRADPDLLAAAKVYYRDHQWDFISDWGMTFDPRKLDAGEIPHMPFILWPRQIEFVKWMQWMWTNRHRGQVEKSRDGGATWLAGSWAATNWLFVPGFVAGFGSRKLELVDKLGDPNTIFYKIRYFINNLPVEFLPEGFSERLHMATARVVNPENEAALIGEGGDQIGRGGRTSVYFIDEYAFVEHQASVDGALSAATDCQIDISTFNGPGNRFFQKNQRLKGDKRLFIFDWRDDPRKDEEWAKAKQEELDDEVVWAMEYERDPYASQTDSFIPAKWVLSAMDAHKVLGFSPSGIRAAGFDPADVGDAKGYAARHGSVLQEVEALRDGDISYAIPWAVDKAMTYRAEVMGYDGDGMGAPAMKVAFVDGLPTYIRLEAYHGSGAVEDPDAVYSSAPNQGRQGKVRHTMAGPVGQGDKTNQDTFLNYRAQKWTEVRERFRKTHLAIERHAAGKLVNFDPDELISIDKETCAHWQQLQAELSAPKRQGSGNGKIKVESKQSMLQREVASPNLADAVIIAYAMKRPPAVPARRRATTRPLADRGAGY